ncbi:hypothetical protein ACMA1I_03455 [Pontibacter sp. 13R65]|uniref:hypothetical protein n=1 Tax=Pontibacter sp. 13R65 TaxID=3127458 RepID=UPI00301C8B2A
MSLLPSCEIISGADTIVVETEPVPSTTYVIHKNQHHAINKIQKVSSPNLKFEATFDSTAIYTSIDPANQGDINKLYGFSDCGSLHQSNSARFGWRWYNNKLEIHAYTYYNGTRKSALISTVALGQTYTYELERQEGRYVFKVNGEQVTLPRACYDQADGYMLYPYFGGDEVAPHDIKIVVKDLP